MTHTIQIHNIETGEVVLREMTESELDSYEQAEAVRLAKAEAEAEAQAKREAALSKLAALGLTADDLRALGL